MFDLARSLRKAVRTSPPLEHISLDPRVISDVGHAMSLDFLVSFVAGFHRWRVWSLMLIDAD